MSMLYSPCCVHGPKPLFRSTLIIISIGSTWYGSIINNKLIMTKHEDLNERDYGDLVGLNKEETANKFGKEQVHIWRRSYDTPPPNGESLKDVVERVSPYFKKNIKPLLDQNNNILIAAHGNSLRAMMIELGMYKPEEISSIELPTGSPLCINLQESQLVDFFYLS